VNPTVYSTAEFSKRTKTDNAFVNRVLEGPKVWVADKIRELPAIPQTEVGCHADGEAQGQKTCVQSDLFTKHKPPALIYLSDR
jgi:hypothetical protein